MILLYDDKRALGLQRSYLYLIYVLQDLSTFSDDVTFLWVEACLQLVY